MNTGDFFSDNKLSIKRIQEDKLTKSRIRERLTGRTITEDTN
jgi:hypothetical protein